MKGYDLYQQIKSFSPNIVERNICELQNCSKCKVLQQSLLIDFDTITKEYCRGRSTLSSSDGVKYSKNKNDVFYFIEIKSIKDAIINPQTNIVNDEDRINSQPNKFLSKIDKKLPNSIEVCCGVSKDNSLFDSKLQPALVFVSDIDTQQSPLDNFYMNLIKLSDPPAYYEIIFNKEIRKGLKNIKERRKVKVYYTFCEIFDDELSSDFQNSLI